MVELMKGGVAVGADPIRTTAKRSRGLNMGYERHSFSQAQGYEEIPGQLKLEELPKEAGIRGTAPR